MDSMNYREQYQRLVDHLKKFSSMVVAFSGGVDSSLLLVAAHDARPGRVLAVTGRSASVPAREIEAAGKLAGRLGVEHRLVDTCELEDPQYRANPPDRCYHCKTHLFGSLLRLAVAEGWETVLEGSNADDSGDYRPGLRAARELGVHSPLRELGLGKEAVRALSRERGLAVWDKPAAACLASRVPYGSPITAERLRRIEAAEEYLQQLGFRQVRVRDHDGVARIEVDSGELGRLIEQGGQIAARLRQLGYLHVAADLEGFCSGSLNRALT